MPFDAVSSAAFSTATSTKSWVHTLSTAGDVAVLVGFHTTASSGLAVSGVTVGGSAATLVVASCNIGAIRVKTGAEIWRHNSVSSGAKTIQVTMNNSSMSVPGKAFALSYSGSTGFESSAKSTGATSAANVVVPVATNSAVPFGIMAYATSAALTSGAGVTIRAQISATAPSAGVGDLAAGSSGNRTITLNKAAAAAWVSAGAAFVPIPPPDSSRSARLHWFEAEVPIAPRRARLHWAEAEVPTAPRRARLHWAEVEVPTLSLERRARLHWAEVEVPTAPRRARLHWAELEAPTAPRRARLHWVEAEFPSGPRRAWLVWMELETPDAPAGEADLGHTPRRQRQILPTLEPYQPPDLETLEVRKAVMVHFGEQRALEAQKKFENEQAAQARKWADLQRRQEILDRRGLPSGTRVPPELKSLKQIEKRLQDHAEKEERQRKLANRIKMAKVRARGKKAKK